MSNDELDRDWKPSNRPQSTMAISFSLALNDLFKIDNSIADLDAAVSEKKKAVSSQTSELEALEARLKATEEQLKLRQSGLERSLSQRSSSSPYQRPAINGDTFTTSPRAEHPTSPLSGQFGNGSAEGRPASQTKQPSYASPPIPGQMPPTPGASEGDYGSEPDYVLVEARKNSADEGEDGDVPQKTT